MANPLQMGGGPPPAPLPDAGQQPQQGGSLAAPQQEQQQQQPAPSHEQAVAAIRHFSAITQQLEGLLQNPGIGKTDLKSKIIDSTTRLVADRIITPAEAVMTLGSVPVEPVAQRKWIEQHFSQSIMAQNAVLDHHRQAFANAPDDQMNMAPSPDDHMDHMKSLMGHYQGGRVG